MHYFLITLTNGCEFTIVANRLDKNDTHYLFYIDGIDEPFCSLALTAVAYLGQQGRPLRAPKG